MVSLMDRGYQYIQLVKVWYCKLPTIGKQLPGFPHKVLGIITKLECHLYAKVLKRGYHMKISNYIIMKLEHAVT